MMVSLCILVAKDLKNWTTQQAVEELNEKNVKRYKEIRERNKTEWIKRYDEQTKRGAKAMEAMTTEQQEEYLGFWATIGTFLTDLLHWVGQLADKIFDLLYQGFRLVTATVKQLLQDAADGLDKVLSWLSQISP